MKALEGILVVALEQAVAAPLATCRLADAGARVIKVERPGGDFARSYDSVIHGEASYFVWVNRGKESIVLDLKTAEDMALLRRMLAAADVFVQNLAPGAAERLGVGAQRLRRQYPRLIVCEISGYGDGDYSQMKAYDFLIQSEAGLVAVSGAPDALGRIGVSVCDIGAGLNAYGAILQALLLRARSGRGSYLQISLFDSAAEWMQVPLAHFEYGGRAPARVGLHHPSIAPYGAYRTADQELIVIAIQNEREWARFTAVILQQPELADDPRFASNDARVFNRPQLNELIDRRFGASTRAELQAQLRSAAVAYGSVNSVADLAAHPMLRRCSMAVAGREVSMVAPPIVIDGQQQRFAPAPILGEHSAAIRAEFAAAGDRDDG